MILERITAALAVMLLLVVAASSVTQAQTTRDSELSEIKKEAEQTERDYKKLKTHVEKVAEEFSEEGRAVAGKEASMERGAPAAAAKGPLDFKKDLALWTGIIFLVLMLVLWKFAWGPIADGLEKREKGIAAQIHEAEQANVDAKQLLADYQQKLDSAGEEVRHMLQQARRDAEKTGRDIVEAARQNAKGEQKKALAEIDHARDTALSELAEKSATMAVDLAGKIVKKELRSADHTELVQHAVDGFMRPNGGRRAK